MRAVLFEGSGGPEVVKLREVPRPVPPREALLVKVHATALNRADLLQRQGEYHVPEGQSSIPGVEIAGTVEAWGEDVKGFTRGQAVFGVVEGGGLAEYCLLDQGMALPIPSCFDFAEAAAASESCLTANETLFALGQLQRGQAVLIHAAASSIGTTMVQMARHVGATTYCTVGTAAKVEALRALGADEVFNHREQDFVREVLRLTRGEGVPLVMDFIGGAYLERNLAVLGHEGILVLVGLLDGMTAQVDLLRVVQRRLQLKGSSLRLRPLREKREVNARFRQRWMEVLARGELRPVIHARYPLEDVQSALAEMEANRNIGKLVLTLEGNTRHA
ncbi:PIG3 family NAD(P)H quinone oxidoreductase [Myxococcus stipitatus DSM 14675]|uniref:PIG3 family NAD(P)H quinone oxidoreductase n=1 Tax=Myxococcus stipitatus (strain DSM 14675 / JCM 12634 / Mx s8) TaxID=1278073 RepID=L7U6V1_MYXSD|nr:NAD(P)H-quinone oxidoreductase [Myxococcus stipitatus]AGC43833.1 PIG3 family NAD(P)H quinone oxidoreductase [Myxococcus stipitatus DSM 14675]